MGEQEEGNLKFTEFVQVDDEVAISSAMTDDDILVLMCMETQKFRMTMLMMSTTTLLNPLHSNTLDQT